MSTGLDRLSPEHLLMLREGSGLADEVIIERGYYTATTFKELRDLGFSERQALAPALVIPLHGVDGKPAGVQARPDLPRTNADGKPVKYESLRGSTPVLDMPPRCQPALANPSIPLFITEGAKKADALANAGACAMSLGGVWNWRGTNPYGGKVALPDWELVPLNDRLVRIVYDSDVATKPAVAAAMRRLKAFLDRKGAKVELVYLPAMEDGEKQGVDDFLASGHSLEDLEKHITSGIKPAVGSGARPRIVVTNRHLRDIAQDCWTCLVADNRRLLRLFQNNGRMVRIDTHLGQARIRELGEPDIHGVMERLADFVKIVARGDLVEEKPGRLPKDVGEDLLVAWEKPLPTLDRVVGTPVVAADGRISVSPGYDEGTGLYYFPAGCRVADVPKEPAPAEVTAAVDLIDEWLFDFPFVDAASRTNAIAIPLTYIGRELIAGPTPLFALTAPTAGTGKGLLATTAGLIMEGTAPAVTTEARSGEEWRKRFTAMLVEGRGLIVIDNVKRRLDAAELAAVLTTEMWGDRLLGKTESVAVRNRAVWMATGNNLELDGELGRRTVLVRIDARTDRPWTGRKFRHEDLPGWVRDHRADLIRAYLVLIRHWVACGRPRFTGERLGTFESWSSVVGGILQAAGIDGFLDNRDVLYAEADRETTEWRAFVHEWWERFGSASVKVGDLLALVREDHLQTLLERIRGDATDQALKIRLGKALAERKDRRIGDVFVRWIGADGHAKGNLYRLELAESVSGGGQLSADSPHVMEADSGSSAESAEGAESVSRPRARAVRHERVSEPVVDQLEEGSAFHSPHSPHLPHSDSETADFDAEGDAESAAGADDSPRCRGCGMGLSSVAISDRCGRCQTEARR